MNEEEELRAIVEKYDSNNEVTDESLIELIMQLADSGRKYSFEGRVFDFASTGGPSSLTTLLVPLYLFGMGMSVINLAVPGRPAGAVDVLSQIPNYNLNMEIGNNHQCPFYIHLAANNNIAPLDERLFLYRRRINKVDVPNLAIASILSKKIASGATNIGLEVRCSRIGNFGHSWAECSINAERYNRIAKQLNLNSICFVTDGNNPYQRYIGRGESLLALKSIIEGNDDTWLQDHKDMCEAMAINMIKRDGGIYQGPGVNINQCFENNLESQGSSMADFYTAIDRIKEQQYIEVCSSKEGYVVFDLKEIREHIVNEQKSRSNSSLYPDPCGVTLLVNSGEYVSAGTPILKFRRIDDMVNSDVSRMFTIQNESAHKTHRMEVI